MKATIYWIDGPWSGRLAIVPRPRGGDWLEDEVHAWRTDGIDVVVSMLQQDEITDLDLSNEADNCRAAGLEYVAFPVADRGVPASSAAFAELVGALQIKLAAGKTVAAHCRQSVGRSAVLAAALLIVGGVECGTAWDRVQQARGCAVPDTADQKEWVTRFADSWRDEMEAKKCSATAR
jgi:protein-tyrosine phosphatase